MNPGKLMFVIFTTTWISTEIRTSATPKTVTYFNNILLSGVRKPWNLSGLIFLKITAIIANVMPINIILFKRECIAGLRTIREVKILSPAVSPPKIGSQRRYTPNNNMKSSENQKVGIL